MRGEPSQQAVFEFLGSGAHSSAVVGVWYFPELHVRITGVDEAGVADGDVAVDLAVNEKDRNAGRRYGIFWRNIIHVQVVLPARAEKGGLDERTEDGASNPRAEVEGLSHAVVGDLTKIGEGGFGGYGAEV